MEEEILEPKGEIRKLKLLDLIEEIRQISEIQSEFNFSLLIEQDPTEYDYNYECKILAIILKEHGKDSKSKFIHFDEIINMD